MVTKVVSIKFAKVFAFLAPPRLAPFVADTGRPSEGEVGGGRRYKCLVCDGGGRFFATRAAAKMHVETSARHLKAAAAAAAAKPGLLLGPHDV